MNGRATSFSSITSAVASSTDEGGLTPLSKIAGAAWRCREYARGYVRLGKADCSALANRRSDNKSHELRRSSQLLVELFC